MKVRPILFSAEMVRALLEGRKTQTRRILKPQPQFHADGGPGWYPHGDAPRAKHYATLNQFQRGMPIDFCPYGKPGDLLWVREAWAPDPDADHDAWDDWTMTYVEWAGCGSRIDGVPPELRTTQHVIYAADPKWDGDGLVWKPSIHMPRWASRLTLKITEVRVQRVQEITPQDCLAEGITKRPRSCPYPWHVYAKEDFASLWRDVNGADAWDRNDWVWAITFEVIAQNVDDYIAGRAMAGPRDPLPTEHFIEKEPTGV